MADLGLRELERRWKSSGEDHDKQRLLSAIERQHQVCVHREITVDTIRGEIPIVLQEGELAARLTCPGCKGLWEVAFKYPRLGSYGLIPGSSWTHGEGVRVTLEVVEMKNQERVTHWRGSWA